MSSGQCNLHPLWVEYRVMNPVAICEVNFKTEKCRRIHKTLAFILCVLLSKGHTEIRGYEDKENHCQT